MIPDTMDFDPMLGSDMAMGEEARKAVYDARQVLPMMTVAVDIETPGLDDPFTIKCMTASWTSGSDDQLMTVLLDPMRNPDDFGPARRIIEQAATLVLHNAAFDVPGLVLAELMTVAEIDKVVDTLVYARMARPDQLDAKGLEACAKRYLGMHDMTGLTDSIKAAGFRSKEQWFREADIDMPAYRLGAMSDTAVTLRIYEHVRNDVVRQLTDHPFETYGLTERSEALVLSEREQTVNRVMMRRSARGLAVDAAYFDSYRESVEAEVDRASLVMHSHGLEPGKGEQMVKLLDSMGELPADWPRTKTGKLSFAKGYLESLDHPLADAHREIAHASKVIGYLDAVNSRSRVTGRLHPQVGVLAASTTGRMSYNDPALQQFPAEARPIITDDGQGLTSIDWSQIEPVTMALMAGDTQFLMPFEAGSDLYEPIQRAAGIDRKTAKVVLLATMYGQGDNGLAATIKQSVDAAMQIKRQMLAAMPESAKFMGRIGQVAAQYGKVITISGRVLDIPNNRGEFMAFKGTNYTIQGSAYDVLAETIATCEKHGLGDHIQLAMHDELVVDTEAAPAIREIMQRPPARLTFWAKREMTLRTDMQDMGHSWASV